MMNLDLADMGSLTDSISYPGKVFKWFGVLSDHFTGYLLGAFPLISKDSSEVAFSVLGLFGCFGFPLFLIHDNGKEFMGALSSELRRLCSGKFKVICTRPRNPKANGAAESNVKWMKAILCKMIFSRQIADPFRFAWARDMPIAQRARVEAYSKWRGTTMS